MNDLKRHYLLRVFWNVIFLKKMCSSWQDFKWQRVARSLCDSWASSCEASFLFCLVRTINIDWLTDYRCGPSASRDVAWWTIAWNELSQHSAVLRILFYLFIFVRLHIFRMIRTHKLYCVILRWCILYLNGLNFGVTSIGTRRMYGCSNMYAARAAR